MQHFHAQIRSGMVALVHDNHRIQIADYLDQRRLISIGQQNRRIIHPLCKLGQIAVLLIGFASFFFAGAEGIIAEHKQGKLFCHSRGGEVLPHEGLFLGVHLHPPAKIYIQPLAVGMVWIFQRPTGLGQNGLGGHQPYNGLGPELGYGVKNCPQRTGGNIGLASAGGHLGTHMGHTGEHIHIIRHTAEAYQNILFIPVGLIRLCRALQFHHQLQVACKIGNDFFLIRFQFHFFTLLYSRAISRGIFLKVMLCLRSVSWGMAHRSA